MLSVNEAVKKFQTTYRHTWNMMEFERESYGSDYNIFIGKHRDDPDPETNELSINKMVLLVNSIRYKNNSFIFLSWELQKVKKEK